MAKDIKRHLSHLKSNTGLAPAASDLVYGEIAVGYKDGGETLYIKNDNDEIVAFTSAAGGEAAAELYTDQRVISTVTGDSEISVTLNAIDKATDSGRTLTITHATGSAQSGFKKLDSDAYGHITGGSAVVLSDLVGLGALSGITAEQGISASTKSDGNQVIGHTNIITAGTAKTSTSSDVVITPTEGSFTTPKIEFDANGHVTSTGTDTINLRINTASTSVAGVVKIATTTGNNNTDVVMTQSAVTQAIIDSFAAQDAMVYKGLVGSANDFPGTFSKGYTYKVATAFTYSNVRYEIGDMFIANTDVDNAEEFTPAHWDAIQTNLDPTLYANTATTVTGDGALEGGGNLGSNEVITHKELAPSGTAGTTSPNTAQTPNFNETFDVPVINYDKYGHITGVTTTTVKIPNSGETWTYYTTGLTVSTATTSNTITLSGTNAAVKGTAILSGASQSAAGLMSTSDKAKLDGIQASAEVNQNAFSNVKVGSTTIEADEKTDTIEFAYGDAPLADAVKGLRIVPDAANDKATFQLGDVECGDYA